ncbi:unnamed protein product [Gadus morhua 'NCC']
MNKNAMSTRNREGGSQCGAATTVPQLGQYLNPHRVHPLTPTSNPAAPTSSSSSSSSSSSVVLQLPAVLVGAVRETMTACRRGDSPYLKTPPA